MEGAAIGSLGRHTQIIPDGMPVFDDRVEVLFKVRLWFWRRSYTPDGADLKAHRSSTSRN